MDESVVKGVDEQRVVHQRDDDGWRRQSFPMKDVLR
jgi:hypothetical protein